MSTEITTAMVNQYSSNVQLLSQQKGSRLRRAVRNETLSAEYGYFEQIGAVTAQLKSGRHSDTPQYDTPHARRRVEMADYNWADFIDNQDQIRTLIDPTSPYAVNAVNAFGRACDDVIITAARASAATGKDGSTGVTFPAGNVVAIGTTGLTVDKLRTARELFWANEVDEDIPLFLACTGKQLSDLLNTTEVTSADYNTVKALVSGDVDFFMGFNFIRTERLDNTTTNRHCLAWAQDGILLAVGQDIKTRISERPDKSYLEQVYVEMSIGATRMEETKVIQIDCLEA